MVAMEAFVGDEQTFNSREVVFHGDGIAAVDSGGVVVLAALRFLLDERPRVVQVFYLFGECTPGILCTPGVAMGTPVVAMGRDGIGGIVGLEEMESLVGLRGAGGS